jgi:hypothetical protein
MVVACMYVNLCVIDYCANLPPKITARNLQRTRLRIRFAGRGSLTARNPV